MSGACLCIGGPLDGEHRTYSGEHFHAAIPDPLPLYAPIALASESTSAMRTVMYRAEPFRCGATRWTIYVADGLSTEDAFEQLIMNYGKGVQP